MSHNLDKCEDKNSEKIKFFSDIFINKTTTNQLDEESNTSLETSYPVEYRMNKVQKTLKSHQEI